jgi:hypothetical protein
MSLELKTGCESLLPFTFLIQQVVSMIKSDYIDVNIRLLNKHKLIYYMIKPAKTGINLVSIY